MKIWLAAMDLDVSDVEELFFMLDDGGVPRQWGGEGCLMTPTSHLSISTAIIQLSLHLVFKLPL